MDDKVRLIKKYPNRRLYDTGESKYIKLTEVKKMIEEGVSLQVVDSQSGENITRSILLQIIYEQESNNEPLFSTDNLENFIRYYNESSREGFTMFIGKNLEFFHEQQEQFQGQFKGLLDFNPVDFWSNSTKSNLDIWQQMQDNFMLTAGLASTKKNGEKDK